MEGCEGRATIRTNLQIRFVRRNVQDIVVILEEEKHFHPHFPSCDFFCTLISVELPPTSNVPLCVGSGEEETASCGGGGSGGGSDGVLILWYATLNSVVILVPGRLLTATNYYWSSSISNLQKARNIWFCLARILGQECADTQTLVFFNVAVVQFILLSGK